MKKIIRVKNNNVIIGKVKVDLDIIKIAATVGGFVLITTSYFNWLDNTREELKRESDLASAMEWAREHKETEKTYSDIEYTVSFGDTLEGIVSSYQSDRNKLYQAMDDIVRDNNLDSKNSIRANETIKLCHVPESHLADFGYTLDYSKVNPECELDDLKAFIDDEITYIYITDENERVLADFEARYSYATIMYDQYQKDKDSIVLERILEEYRRLGQEIADIAGVNYDRSIKPHKIDETYSKGMNY